MNIIHNNDNYYMKNEFIENTEMTTVYYNEQVKSNKSSILAYDLNHQIMEQEIINTMNKNRGGRKQVKVGTTKRNARERNRVRYINYCFDILRQHIPMLSDECYDLDTDQTTSSSICNANRKLSKVETLKYATKYIKQLTLLLDQCSENDIPMNLDTNSTLAQNVCSSTTINNQLTDNNLNQISPSISPFSSSSSSSSSLSSILNYSCLNSSINQSNPIETNTEALQYWHNNENSKLILNNQPTSTFLYSSNNNFYNTSQIIQPKLPILSSNDHNMQIVDSSQTMFIDSSTTSCQSNFFMEEQQNRHFNCYYRY